MLAGKEKIQPFEVAQADFTQLICANGRRKAQLIPIVDHATQLILSWAVAERAVTKLARVAWDQASRTLRHHAVPLEEVIVHHDQDPVFTGYGWTARLLLEDYGRVSYALHGTRDTILAQGNPEMGAFNSRFKTENRSLLLDAQTLEDLAGVVAERMGYHNRERRHSTIGYRAPVSYIATLQPWP